ncbi:hypothetical protein FIBSPDRAFT_470074 [Athelia psychrophila]|uniref:Uncharacterized protein n=1 Tax=Athelia psychrophila TaxID=1759441 RepID=A0A167U1T7_9AGAM|nr:hypothetical protein FIBSPDRAFT_470074 [Fibularhizoctonia sp. CBS 109695]
MVSRSLPVWRGQYARYLAANPNSAPLDAPMDSYSPSELEEVVLQRSAVELGWLARVEHPVSTTTIPHAEANRATFHIVEGGRWLLSSIQGSVTVYDLDNPNTPGKLIIPKYARTPILGRVTTNLSVDVLTDTSTLTFNIAIEQGGPGMAWCPVNLLVLDCLLYVQGMRTILHGIHVFGGSRRTGVEPAQNYKLHISHHSLPRVLSGA